MNVKDEPEYLSIGDYGIIGNLQTAALASLHGSIDFYCYPRFDSPSIFCKLLDSEKGGSFSIVPKMNNTITKQMYLPDTNVLLTRFFADEGIAEITDFMPINHTHLPGALIRIVTTIRGNIEFSLHCQPRFDYARGEHNTDIISSNTVRFTPANGLLEPLALTGSCKMDMEGPDATCTFKLNESEKAYFILEPAGNVQHHNGDLHALVQQAYRATIKYWQDWIDQCTYKGRWQEVVHRSALTLKLLISDQYGSMVAAPTFGLPEGIGTERTWDYRYTWIRDAAFSMHAFMQLGFVDEAKRFLHWVRDQSTNHRLQLMFAIDGSTNLEEKILHHLEGYKKSKPVRIGNAAYNQVQVDIYGELLETIYLYVSHGGELTFEYWKIIQTYVEWVICNWQLPDHSIWEVRGPKREFLFSRMMCWITIDRAIRIGEDFSFPFELERWREARDKIFYDIYENFWSEEKQAFVQYKGARVVDASALLLPILRIVSPLSARWTKTMEAIDRELRADVLVHRYREIRDDIDGLHGEEGTFSICSFWYVECLALMGKSDEAKEHFEKMLGYANHLGLFAEQLGLKGEHLGNFPQAFTHLALISAAVELSNNDKMEKSTTPSY